MMLLAVDTPSSNYSTRRCVLFSYRINRTVAGLLQSIQAITHTWSDSASCQSTLFKPKTFLTVYIYSSTRITRRNTLLNDSDGRHFVSHTHFYCQCYCSSLCIQLVTSANTDTGLQKYFTKSTFIAYFT